MADVIVEQICETPGCANSAKLRCPTCIKYGINGSFFCSQDCFKGNWTEHKQVHKKAKEVNKPYNPWPDYHFTGKLRPFPLTPKREVPESIMRPDYADHPQDNDIKTNILSDKCKKKGVSLCESTLKGTTSIKILDEEEIEGVKLASKLAREVLDTVAAQVAVGVTTDELDRIVHENSKKRCVPVGKMLLAEHKKKNMFVATKLDDACIERDCYPSPLNYYCFPKSCCTSVNEVICHGIPDLRPLEDGDILNIDITVYHKGFHGDLNETFLVGNVDEAGKKLVKVTYECLMKAIEAVKPGEKYREIGNVIQKYVQAHGFSVVRSYCGHGIHRLFHTTPSVPHYAKNKAIGVMKPGHCFTIEPMISEGTWVDETWPDEWTAVTKDGKRSAQFEQTLLVTETGCEILTRRRSNDGKPYFMDNLK